MDFNVPSAAEGDLRTKAGGRGGGARTSADTASLTMRVRQVPLSLFNQTVFRVSLPLEVIFTFVRFVSIYCRLLLLAFVTLFSLVSACFLAIPSTAARASSVMQNDNTTKQKTVRHTA